MNCVKKMIALAQTDPTLKSVSDQQLARDAQRVIRALPELQEAERMLFTPRAQREADGDTANGNESEKPRWKFEGIEGSENQGEEHPQEEGEHGTPREAASWRDQLWVRQVDPETGKPEPPRAFHAFILFRDLAPHQRTLRQVTALLRGTAKTVGSSRPSERTRRREF
ncbi:MAG: hypothetical protein H0X25_15820, partial [Acidobacteriales bacterium]|nr:hypothetical protein [Terriglobales bacterium]